MLQGQVEGKKPQNQCPFLSPLPRKNPVASVSGAKNPPWPHLTSSKSPEDWDYICTFHTTRELPLYPRLGTANMWLHNSMYTDCRVKIPCIATSASGNLRSLPDIFLLHWCLGLLYALTLICWIIIKPLWDWARLLLNSMLDEILLAHAPTTNITSQTPFLPSHITGAGTSATFWEGIVTMDHLAAE